VSEQTEEEYLIERLSKLLAEISVIVNGPQPMGVLWSYADLPQKVQALKDAAALNAQSKEARPLSEWCEDFGPVTWWKLPVEEAAWIGTPNDSDWPGYHTHWTAHPVVPALAAAKGVKP
jgi:hypothetical protein